MWLWLRGSQAVTKASAGVAVISRLRSGELPSEPTQRAVGGVEKVPFQARLCGLLHRDASCSEAGFSP